MFTLPPTLCGERYIDPNLQAVQDLIDQAAAEAERRMPVEVMLAVDGQRFEEAVVTRQQYKAVLSVLLSLSHKVAEAIEHSTVNAQAVSPADYSNSIAADPASGSFDFGPVAPQDYELPEMPRATKRKKVS